MKDILTYGELISREGFNIQRGMNYRPLKKNYSILLMSVRDDSPYNDSFDSESKILYYEGEDISKRDKDAPKKYDQPFFTKKGEMTNNGTFFKLCEDYRLGRRSKPEKVKVYEKIHNNVWADKGYFSLVDCRYSFSEKENRNVFKYSLLSIDASTDNAEEVDDFEFSRRIPTYIKRIVWERDNGRCVECSSTRDLHFDHIIPFSKGGSSSNPKNIQILCSKHNLQKSSRIQ